MSHLPGGSPHNTTMASYIEGGREDAAWERKQAERHHPRDTEPIPDPPGLSEGPWSVGDWRQTINALGHDQRVIPVMDDHHRRIVGYAMREDDASTLAAAHEMREALELLFDEHGLTTGRRLASGIMRARHALRMANLTRQ